MEEYPVKLGSMLFTLVDPHKGKEVAYNRWYERDHFYAGCMIGPWLFAGRRWVATRELKDLRFPAEGPVAVPVDAGSYLAIYWVHADHGQEHFDWAGEQVHWLYSNGRGFAERDHVHTDPFGDEKQDCCTQQAQRDPHFRRHRGIVLSERLCIQEGRG